MTESPWRIPNACGFLASSEKFSHQFPGNFDLARINLGLSIRCGYAAEAQTALNRHVASFAGHPLLESELMKAQYRIWANLADTENLSVVGELPDLEAHRLIALGNALDAKGQRERAISTYQTILKDNRAERAILNVAKTRIEYPFVPSPKVAIKQTRFSPPTCF